jgi:NitT/TauT family transport system permease protein
MGLLISLVVTIMTVLTGFLETSSSKQMLMRTLGANKWQTFMKVVLPASIPTMMSALKLSVGMSWVGVIVGEYLVSKAGLGYLIVYGGQVFQLNLVMASIIILCILAAMMYYIVAFIEKMVVKWK